VPSPYSDSGLSFSSIGAEYLIDNGPGATNGTSYLLVGFSNTIAAVDGKAFSLSQLDLGLSYYTGTQDTVLLTGNIAGGGSVSKTLNLTQSFQTFQLTGFDNLNSLVVGQLSHGGYLAYDNINYTQGAQVPEPASLALLGLGFAGIALSRRRKQA
jgi:hypothetical protein